MPGLRHWRHLFGHEPSNQGRTTRRSDLPWRAGASPVGHFWYSLGAIARCSAVGSHPAFQAHPIQGWTPDFIPQILEKGLDVYPHDEMVLIPPLAAMKTAQALAQTQGIFTGISGGASMYIAVEIAKRAPPGSVIVAIIADTGERYLSTPLFNGIEADMNEEEIDIAKSTPGYQLLPAA